MEHSLAPSALIEGDTDVAPGTTVGPGSWIRFGASLSGSALAGGVFVGFRSRLDRVRAASGCQIASLARIGRPGGAPVTIGAGAWIGARAVVDPGVRIGPGAVVAAGAHAVSDVPPDTIVVGRPARALRRRVVTEDEAPDFTATIDRVRARTDAGRAPLPAHWISAGGGFLDAALSGGPGVSLGPGVVAMGRPDGPSARGGVRVGTRTRIGAGAILEGSGGIDIGPESDLGDGVLVVSSGHDPGRRSLPWQDGPVRIGAGVTIGAGATIVGPCRLGDGAVVAPDSVVVRDVPAGGFTTGVIPSASRTPHAPPRA
ncbi:DapH/DapD/GlmU-related protein [Streptomyces erythrochromogenes]|uniref:DapH/DapD/GlmU-related protein n=1 Tax=Streptomyces erythrochromogenes TaxID=285574 RepID=UPI003333B680